MIMFFVTMNELKAYEDLLVKANPAVLKWMVGRMVVEMERRQEGLERQLEAVGKHKRQQDKDNGDETHETKKRTTGRL